MATIRRREGRNGALPGADSLDHEVPLAAGGANVPSNWRPAHLSCNSRRGSKLIHHQVQFGSYGPSHDSD